MGKITKTIYVCDICEKELGTDQDKIDRCLSCGSEVCEECSHVFRHSIESNEDEIFTSFQRICNNCISDKQKIKEAFKKELEG